MVFILQASTCTVKNNLLNYIIMIKKYNEISITSATQWIQHQIKPELIENYAIPSILIIGFFPTLYQYVRKNYKPTIIDKIRKNNPVYIFEYLNHKIAFVFPGFGASISSLVFEECLALGSEQILFIGSCGNLNNNRDKFQIHLLEGAYSDDGTSKHYFEFKQPLIHCNKNIIQKSEKYLNRKKIPYQKGFSWTTDAVYRETASKIIERKKQGCICVDMEAAALISIAKYYNKQIGGILVPSDALTEEKWTLPNNALHISSSKLFAIALNILVS